jgi:hypothetical protein
MDQITNGQNQIASPTCVGYPTKKSWLNAPVLQVKLFLDFGPRAHSLDIQGAAFLADPISTAVSMLEFG